MVRKGSTVRVRQRALGNPPQTAGFVVEGRFATGPHASLWKSRARAYRARRADD
jgi:hypothetical protein